MNMFRFLVLWWMSKYEEMVFLLDAFASMVTQGMSDQDERDRDTCGYRCACGYG